MLLRWKPQGLRLHVGELNSVAKPIPFPHSDLFFRNITPFPLIAEVGHLSSLAPPLCLALHQKLGVWWCTHRLMITNTRKIAQSWWPWREGREEWPLDLASLKGSQPTTDWNEKSWRCPWLGDLSGPWENPLDLAQAWLIETTHFKNDKKTLTNSKRWWALKAEMKSSQLKRKSLPWGLFVSWSRAEVNKFLLNS